MKIQHLTPPLRFKNFSDQWAIKKGSDLFINSRVKGNDNLPLYSVTLDRGMIPRNSLDRRMESDAEPGDNLLVKKDDISYNMMRMWQGAFGVAPVDCMVSPAYVVLHPRAEVSSDFFSKYFNRTRSLYLFTAYSYGLTSDRLRLYFKDFARIKFAVPELPEQQKIASFISSVDEKIRQLTRKKELLEQYKKGVMQQLFSGKIRFKDEDGKDYPEWESRKFGEVVKLMSSKYDPEKEQGSISCIELENLSTNTGQLLGTSNGENSSSIKNKFKKGDVLFGKLRPYLRKYLIAPFDGVCSSEIWVLDGIGVLNEFLFMLVQTNSFIDLTKKSTGSKMPRADWNVVQSGIFQIPSIQEQQKIATVLALVDAKIEIVTNQITQTQTFKKGLLQQMFV